MENVTVIGYLGSDAKGKMNENGRYNLWASVAVTKRYQKDGEEKEKTNWWRVFVSYKEEPKKLMEYLKKGTQVVFFTDEITPQVKTFEGQISVELVASARKIKPVTFEK